MKRQQGLLLLPVALALSIMGALAYAMTRGGADDASAVDAQYDLEATRYLAEAGLRLAKWQNEKKGCKSELPFTSVGLPGVAGTVSVETLKTDKGNFRATVTASSPRGAVSSLSGDKMMFYDRSRENSMTLEPEDTYIASTDPFKPFGNSDELEATDGKAHILISMSPAKMPKDARITRATLKLYLKSSNSVQTVRELAAHALTRDWNHDNATWTYPWIIRPGGSYDPRQEDVASIGVVNRQYTWELGPLLRRWDSGEQENFGVLLKPAGLNRARFSSQEGGPNPPRVDISYHSRCK